MQDTLPSPQGVHNRGAPLYSSLTVLTATGTRCASTPRTGIFNSNMKPCKCNKRGEGLVVPQLRRYAYFFSPRAHRPDLPAGTTAASHAAPSSRRTVSLRYILRNLLDCCTRRWNFTAIKAAFSPQQPLCALSVTYICTAVYRNVFAQW